MAHGTADWVREAIVVLLEHESTHVAGGADEINSPLAIAAMADLTSTKLWQGNVSNRPVEVDMPAGVSLVIAETEVFSGDSPTDWTDLNLSGTIGAQATLVMLKIASTVGSLTWAVRKNGDTDEFYKDDPGTAGGVALAEALDISQHMVLIVATDTSGIIEWIASHVVATTIDIIAYLK